MTVNVIREPKAAQCSCGMAGTDWGELEEHVVSAGASEHYPVDPAHVTDQIREARERAERAKRTLDAVARSAGVSVDELRELLR